MILEQTTEDRLLAATYKVYWAEYWLRGNAPEPNVVDSELKAQFLLRVGYQTVELMMKARKANQPYAYHYTEDRKPRNPGTSDKWYRSRHPFMSNKFIEDIIRHPYVNKRLKIQLYTLPEDRDLTSFEDLRQAVENNVPMPERKWAELRATLELEVSNGKL